MPTSTATARRAGRQRLRSPLAARGELHDVGSGPAEDTGSAVRAALPAPRAVTLRTTTNRDGRPYEAASISAYLCPAKTLDGWMSANGLDGGFTVVDTALLNRFFRDYYDTRGQGGTHTMQRNLIQLFNFLKREHGHPTPCTAALNRYAEVKGRPKTRPRTSSTTCWMSPAEGERATSKSPATTPSSTSCAAGHPPPGTAQHGRAHPPRRPDQEPSLPAGATQGHPRRRGGRLGMLARPPPVRWPSICGHAVTTGSPPRLSLAGDP